MPNESLSALEASWRKWLEWVKLDELAGMSAAGTPGSILRRTI
jgi:hypothetical protein